MAMKIGKGVIGLGISEAKLKIWDTWETPGRPIFCRELGRDPKFEGLRLADKLVIVFTMVDEREARDVYPPAIVVLADALDKKVLGLGDLKNLVGSLGLDLLLVPQAMPSECVRTEHTTMDLRTHCLSSISMGIQRKPLGVMSCRGF